MFVASRPSTFRTSEFEGTMILVCCAKVSRIMSSFLFSCALSLKCWLAASDTSFMAFAWASAISSTERACPSAFKIDDCFSPWAFSMAACFSCSAASFRPVASKRSCRRSCSAVFCLCMAV